MTKKKKKMNEWGLIWFALYDLLVYARFSTLFITFSRIFNSLFCCMRQKVFNQIFFKQHMCIILYNSVISHYIILAVLMLRFFSRRFHPKWYSCENVLYTNIFRYTLCLHVRKILNYIKRVLIRYMYLSIEYVPRFIFKQYLINYIFILRNIHLILCLMMSDNGNNFLRPFWWRERDFSIEK